MNQPQKNTALVGAIIAGLLSLPMTWLTIHGAKFNSGMQGFDQMFGSALNTISLPVTGMNGSLTVFVKTPIWFIVVIAVSASLLQLAGQSKMFAIPRALEWVAAILGTAWVTMAFLMALFSNQATPGIGVILGLVCAIVPVVCLVVGDKAPIDHDEAA